MIGKENVLPTARMICIVDDDDDVRTSLESFLRSAGLPVRGYNGSDGFLARATLQDTGCLVTDLHMPGMDGLTLYREVRRQNLTFPVIVMTAFPTNAACDAVAALGDTSLLAKPIDPEMLLELIEALLL